MTRPQHAEALTNTKKWVLQDKQNGHTFADGSPERLPAFPSCRTEISHRHYIYSKKTSMKKVLALLLLLSSVFSIGMAQNVFHVKGKVSDAGNQQPISFAYVEVRSSENNSLLEGGVTDEDGAFDITLAKMPASCLLVVKSMGYHTDKRDLNAGSHDNLNISLHEESTTLNEVVVNGLNQAEKVQRLAYNVSMLETSALKNTTFDLATAMDRISGVKIRQSGGVGSDADVTLNGFSGKHVKVFIDGVPMDGMSSAFGLNNIPAGLAKRVEVYKGVVPIELGGDALGGAINIVTDDSRRTRVNASYSYGSFNTHKSQVYAEYTSKKGFHVSLNAYQNYSDNDYKVNIDHYTHFGPSGNEVIYKDLKVRRFHARYHNEAAILKIGVVDKPYADRL